LERAGIEWIEMGHGLGLGATEIGFVISKKFGKKKDIKFAAQKKVGFIIKGLN